MRLVAQHFAAAATHPSSLCFVGHPSLIYPGFALLSVRSTCRSNFAVGSSPSLGLHPTAFAILESVPRVDCEHVLYPCHSSPVELVLFLKDIAGQDTLVIHYIARKCGPEVQVAFSARHQLAARQRTALRRTWRPTPANSLLGPPNLAIDALVVLQLLEQPPCRPQGC